MQQLLHVVFWYHCNMQMTYDISVLNASDHYIRSSIRVTQSSMVSVSLGQIVSKPGRDSPVQDRKKAIVMEHKSSTDTQDGYKKRRGRKRRPYTRKDPLTLWKPLPWLTSGVN